LTSLFDNPGLIDLRHDRQIRVTFNLYPAWLCPHKSAGILLVIKSPFFTLTPRFAARSTDPCLFQSCWANCRL
jgi:hypothetical protein